MSSFEKIIRIRIVVDYDIDVEAWAEDMDCAPTPKAVLADAREHLTAWYLLPSNLENCMRVHSPILPDEDS